MYTELSHIKATCSGMICVSRIPSLPVCASLLAKPSRSILSGKQPMGTQGGVHPTQRWQRLLESNSFPCYVICRLFTVQHLNFHCIACCLVGDWDYMNPTCSLLMLFGDCRNSHSFLSSVSGTWRLWTRTRLSSTWTPTAPATWTASTWARLTCTDRHNYRYKSKTLTVGFESWKKTAS